MAIRVRSLVARLAFVCLCAVVGLLFHYLQDEGDEFFSLEEIAFFGVVAMVVISFLGWHHGVSVKKDTVLLVGLSGAGKTRIFGRIVSKSEDQQVYSSLDENKVELEVKGEPLKLVDFPGAERIRPQLEEKWLRGERRDSLKRILFVVDAATFSKKARDVAEFLYDVLLKSEKQVPVVIVCNKQDLNSAKSEQVINSTLEKEMGLINKSRAASLASTDGSSTCLTLTSTGADFHWSDLPISVEFIQSTVADAGGIDDLRAKIRE